MHARLRRAAARLWRFLNSLPPQPPAKVIPLKPHRPRRKIKPKR